MIEANWAIDKNKNFSSQDKKRKIREYADKKKMQINLPTKD